MKDIDISSKEGIEKVFKSSLNDIVSGDRLSGDYAKNLYLASIAKSLYLLAHMFYEQTRVPGDGHKVPVQLLVGDSD